MSFTFADRGVFGADHRHDRCPVLPALRRLCLFEPLPMSNRNKCESFVTPQLKIPSEVEVAPRYKLLTLSLQDNSRSVFMVINGSRSVFLVPGWFFMFFYSSRLVFHGSRWFFHGYRSVFVVFQG